MVVQMDPISLDDLQGWWENPYSQNGIGMQYVKGNQVFIGNAQIKENLKILHGRKVKFENYIGVVRPGQDLGAKEISWDKNNIIWTHIGELPDMYDPDTKTGRFKYTALLGKGANGVVCEAIDTSAAVERKVAVKVLRLSSLATKREVYKSASRMHFEYLWSRMFLHNAKHEHFNPEQGRLFLQYLEDHTGLPPAPESCFSASEVDQLNGSDNSHRVSRLPYVVMELAKGETSWKALFEKEAESARSFSLRDKRELLQQLWSALAYLRKFDLVHRDLNFHNIFVSRIKGRLGIAIGDFGMMSSRTQALVFAPCNEEGWKMRDWVPWEAWNLEIATTNGRHGSPGRRAQSPMPVLNNCYQEDSWQAFDVFSLGVLHLYMCFGQTESRRILEHVRGEQESPAFRFPSSRSLIFDAALALRMISKDPDERPHPSEVLASLQSVGTFWSILTCPSRAFRATPASHDRSRARSRSRGRHAAASQSAEVVKRRVYLPMELNGKKVLVNDGPNMWHVTTRYCGVQPGTLGLGHRKTKNLDDHIEGRAAMVKWGERVSGIDEGDGWVRCDV